MHIIFILLIIAYLLAIPMMIGYIFYPPRIKKILGIPLGIGVLIVLLIHVFFNGGWSSLGLTAVIFLVLELFTIGVFIHHFITRRKTTKFEE